ncbi:MAG: DUF3892 domain-containing protein [Armatimonadetes bacterium]|nr:DUF3892 domain-containing protein [Armatimonadota bacterium]
MTERKVTHTQKDNDGDIIALCNPDETWSPILKADAIRDIESQSSRYYVQVGYNKVYIHVVSDQIKGKYLRTDPDCTDSNNLDDLPDC